MSMAQKIIRSVSMLFLLAFVSCQTNFQSTAQTRERVSPATVEKPQFAEVESAAIKKVLESAVEQTTVTKSYDPAYTVLPYPMGDVPMEKGVCTDVVIRAFRNAGVDLQREVHEDMRGSFAVYPKKWKLTKPDSNIDHRRVPNLQTFFTRHRKSLPITDKAENFKPGDVVAWDLNGKGLTHIGLVSNFYNEQTKRYSIIHNIGGGTQTEDRLFEWKIIGHYRYF